MVDSKGISWTRIWCVYELFSTMLNPSNDEYTYDLYTALAHTTLRGDKKLAVGITQGVAAADVAHAQPGLNVSGTALFQNQKVFREKFFPLELTDLGISFRCCEGQASVETDKTKILEEIGQYSDLLDSSIHGVVAAAALERVLKENRKNKHRYLDALERSPPKILRVDFRGSAGDTQENVSAVVDALAVNGATICKRLELRTRIALEIPESLGQLAELESLVLHGSTKLITLPRSISGLSELKTLDISGCSRLVKVPELPWGVKVLDKPDGVEIKIKCCCCCMQ